MRIENLCGPAVSCMQEAARHAQLAVAADRDNRIDEAVRHYRECLALMPPDEVSLQAHRDNYATRLRLLELRVFERDMHKEPSLADRLKGLRDGKESIVNDPSPVLLEPEEELDSDEQAERVLQQALAEAALGDDDDDDDNDKVAARKTERPI